MEIDYTFEDPKAFTRPWSTTVKFELQVDTDLMDHQCENQKWSGASKYPLRVLRSRRPT